MINLLTIKKCQTLIKIIFFADFKYKKEKCNSVLLFKRNSQGVEQKICLQIKKNYHKLRIIDLSLAKV